MEEYTEEMEEIEIPNENDKFLSMARDAYEQGESFLEMAMYSKWRKNYSLSKSQHPDGSKYLSDQYRRRSRNFRGKTEASIRKNEAAMAVAMFSHEDVTSITAINKDDEAQTQAAENLHELVNSRLEDSVSWFLISIGAYHEAMVSGNVVSEQYWDYDRTADGEVKTDKPAIDLYPPENVKISPYANWLDPIHSSPYVVIEIPMFVGDIKDRMKADWIEAADSQILAAKNEMEYNQVRSSREGNKQAAGKDSASTAITDFDVVYVHKNFIRKDGQDFYYMTLGTQSMLSEPVPVTEVYPHLKEGERPLCRGCISVEPHVVYNRSLVDRVEGSQILINDIANLRMDNVRQVLNKRKYAMRGSGVDFSQLTQSHPGGVVLMDRLDAVREEETPDVTNSSYQEQNLLNVDFDDLAGSFSNASVATNRSLNETVGGMSMLQGNSNTLTEYQMRILVETWVEPVIRQVTRMVQFYEDDERIQEICGPEFTSESLQIPVKTRVSVGFGSTDPQQKVQKLLMGLQAMAQVVPPEALVRLKGMKIIEEIFGYLGFNDGQAFIEPEGEEQDPQVQQLMEQLQQMQQVIEQKQIEASSAKEIEELRGQRELVKAMMTITAQRQLKLTELAVQNGWKVDELQQRAGVDNSKLNLDLLQEVNRRLDIDSRNKELAFKERTGLEGI